MDDCLQKLVGGKGGGKADQANGVLSLAQNKVEDIIANAESYAKNYGVVHTHF